MKRSWIGFVLLIVLLAAGLWVTWAMGEIHDPIASDLTSAGEFAVGGDWETARLYLSRASGFWEKQMLFRSSFADHNPMEEIDACFAQLEIFARMKEETAFAAACAETSRKVEAMGDAHGLKWENLL